VNAKRDTTAVDALKVIQPAGRVHGLGSSEVRAATATGLKKTGEERQRCRFRLSRNDDSPLSRSFLLPPPTLSFSLFFFFLLSPSSVEYFTWLVFYVVFATLIFVATFMSRETEAYGPCPHFVDYPLKVKRLDRIAAKKYARYDSRPVSPTAKGSSTLAC
jgi:hypothetical protein